MKKVNDTNIIHLMKGRKKYITILPYEKFKELKNKADLLDEKAGFELRFKEELLPEILSLFSGDLEKICNFIREIEKLKNNPFPEKSEKIVSRVYKILILNIILTYRVNKQKKLITVLSLNKAESI
ncbi:MAG: hypothetical protein RMJ81_05770 [Candidatus Kryptonium sp.]|nr:hypothetical protein [Candidatus Kryptonium sp.]